MENLSMELPQRRVIGSLILLLGVSFFIIGLQSDQLSIALNIVKQILEAAIAGVP
jgi:hypothetical protein